MAAWRRRRARRAAPAENSRKGAVESRVASLWLLALAAQGKFNPYAELDLSAVKGGKRSGTKPRSGNRSYTYK